MTKLIDDALEVAKTSVHEAGHLICAQAVGGTPTAGEVNFENFSGAARYTLPNNRLGGDSIIGVAGAVAEAKFAGGHWRDYLSGDDRKQLVEMAESAGAEPEAFIRLAAREARPIIDKRWNDIRRLARRLLQAGGTLEFKK